MKILVFVLGLLLAVAPAAHASDAPPELAAVEAYLNGLSTMKARFLQTDNAGHVVSGVFHLSRPGRMRFQYDPPLNDFIVADGLFVHYYDAELKHSSNTPVSLSLADFFLRKRISLSGDVSVTDVQREGGQLRVTLVQTQDPAAGSLTLFFSQKPFQLSKWRVVDAEGAVTDIALSQVEAGITLDPTLFVYKNPDRGKKEYN